MEEVVLLLAEVHQVEVHQVAVPVVVAEVLGKLKEIA
jgi:hypothetical protein